VIYKFVTDGGYTMIPLLVASVLCLGLILERSWHWVVLWLARDERLRAELLTLAVDRRRAEATRDPVASVLYHFIRTQDAEMAAALAEKKLRETKRALPVVNIITTVSCSLGLFGTVIGVSMAFSTLALGRNETELAAALSVALNTTMFGLVIYLLGYIASSVSNLLSSRMAHQIEEGLNVIQARLRTKKVGDVVLVG